MHVTRTTRELIEVQNDTDSEILNSHLKNIFYFALPGSLDLKRLSGTEWIVKFPYQGEGYTNAAMDDVSKRNPWCKSFAMI